MKLYSADFETTTDINDCRVWAYALYEIEPTFTNFQYGNSIDDLMKWCEEQRNVKLYFHNLKFDGEFILNWLFQNGFEYVDNKKDRKSKTFTTLISDMGMFYSIEIYFVVRGNKTFKTTILDSLKILNFSVDAIARDFNLPVHKLELDYQTKREVGHKLTGHEVDYIRCDVEIMARALYMMFERNLTKSTIGSDALSNYKDTIDFEFYYPTLKENVDTFLRKSYKGGFTYLNPKYVEKITGAGKVLDVNSLYPSVMLYERLPYGQGLYYKGQYKEDCVYNLYIQRIECGFELKKNKIPSIQIKHNMYYKENEYLESSNGQIVELTLTNVDLELFFEQYDVFDLEYLDGFKFMGKKNLFKDYIEYWYKEKEEADREHNKSRKKIAKLMLNSLYGKFGTNPVSGRKIPYYEDGVVRYKYSDEERRPSVYIPMASFITSYARRKTILSSQAIRDYTMQKYGVDMYVYSDTDSIHTTLTNDEELQKIIDVDAYHIGAWKIESEYVKGKYLRQKCYIEEQPDGTLNTTVAGLPKKSGKILNFDNFRIGFSSEEVGIEYEKKLTYKHVKGGVVLVETEFSIK